MTEAGVRYRALAVAELRQGRPGREHTGGMFVGIGLKTRAPELALGCGTGSSTDWLN